jgi:hypothetical protein
MLWTNKLECLLQASLVSLVYMMQATGVSFIITFFIANYALDE